MGYRRSCAARGRVLPFKGRCAVLGIGRNVGSGCGTVRSQLLGLRRRCPLGRLTVACIPGIHVYPRTGNQSMAWLDLGKTRRQWCSLLRRMHLILSRWPSVDQENYAFVAGALTYPNCAWGKEVWNEIDRQVVPGLPIVASCRRRRLTRCSVGNRVAICFRLRHGTLR